MNIIYYRMMFPSQKRRKIVKYHMEYFSFWSKMKFRVIYSSRDIFTTEPTLEMIAKVCVKLICNNICTRLASQLTLCWLLCVFHEGSQCNADVSHDTMGNKIMSEIYSACEALHGSTNDVPSFP